jgi:hypothetical protein
LVKEFNFTDSDTNYTFSTFTHRMLPNNTINYYMNDDGGISIFDQDWNFIQRINFNSLNQDISLRGNMFIDDEYIYVGNVFIGDTTASGFFSFFLKLDNNLNIINYQYFQTVQLISMAFDSCSQRIFVLWTNVYLNSSKINMDVYNLYLRKISETNTTSINSNLINFNRLSPALVYFDNQLYISYKDEAHYQYIMVTDINGQFIKTYSLIQTSIVAYMYSFTFDHFGNILFTSMGQLCIFETSLNRTINCTEIFRFDEYSSQLTYDYPLYAQVDQSGRLIVIDSFKQKIQIYY